MCYNIHVRSIAMMIVTILSVLYSHAEVCVAVADNSVKRIVVIDADTQLPLAGARIIIGRQEWLTSKDGYAEVPSAALVGKICMVKNVGYEPVSVDIRTLVSAETPFTVRMMPSINSLEEVVVSGKYGENSPVRQSVALGSNEIQRNGGVSLAKMLESVSGVSTISNGATISKPVIQGMHSSRILLLDNGIRLEGQGWGADHAPEIDQTGFGKAEVVKGAESVRYGSGALGGVVLLNPAPLPYGSDRWSLSGYAGMGYATNGRGKDVSATVETGKGAWAVRLHGLWRYSGDYSTARYLLNNTGQRENSWSLFTGYRAKKFDASVFASWYHTKSGIFFGSHVGGLEDLLARFRTGRPVEESVMSYTSDIRVPYQQADHLLLKGELAWHLARNSHLILDVAYQHNHRQEYENRRSEIYDYVPVMDIHLRSFSLDLRWRKPWKPVGWETQCGFSTIYQRNINQEGTASTPFIPNYTTLASGVYLIQKAVLGGIQAEIGLRYDFRNTDASGYDWRRELYGGTKRYSNFTGSMAFYRQFDRHFAARINMGLAWRAPDVNELYSNGLHHGSSWSLGNRDLKSERGYKFVAGAEYKEAWLSVEPSLFYQYIGNYIYDSPDKSLGEGGIHVHWNGVYPIFAFRQDNCHFYGADLNARAVLPKGFALKGKGEWTRARNATLHTWLPLIPSDRYTFAAEWQCKWGRKRQWKAEARVENLFVCKQTRFDREKELVDDTPPAYYLLNTYAEIACRIGSDRTVRVMFSTENLLNNEYKEYTDRFRYYAHAPGRSVSVRTVINF